MSRSLKSVDVDPELYEEFKRLAKSYGMTNKDLFGAMIRYFKVTQADPRDPQAVNPTDAIKALDKRLIGFIREQEKKILRPLSDDVKVLITLMQEDLPRKIGQAHLRAIGNSIRPDLLSDRFKAGLAGPPKPPVPPADPNSPKKN
ncbi:BfmA/BtgA family mobilization protein [Telluribacter humicola]|uniref:BfmA/BtgA family mobilization protein n=1 Tax=Telluribacter humicola TaxID=1720261 RepID=UPI001A965E40|nr:BfmA/BtgA family mobilization protein [Telluribacter humicola]